MFDFQHKQVLVTGGASGIGRAIAEAFAQAGADVTVADLAAGEPLPAPIRLALADVSDSAAIERLIDPLPALHVLVNAAGILRRDEEFKLAVFEQVLAVNLTGVMRACQAAHAKLAASAGAIVNIASMLSFFGGARVPAYSASKGGVVQLTRSLAVAWAAEGIRVNAVAPGWISTPLTKALQDDPARSAELLRRTPLTRWGHPREVAQAVLFLASPHASFITGAVLPVDGGYSIS